ncbi:hypothetical protein HN371_09235 [Candidatus Poribacteria bacterium]|nr:hypothetical protein [Candidatus Poribacteria bacterium]MBT5531917.1 hypothetical protein [Candidatus Poribacteria bacterium]MBT5710371.1 hypothetical protein [Candidatus Poribacteria bacterium]
MKRIGVALTCAFLVTTVHAAESPWERVFPSLDNVRDVIWYDGPNTWWVTTCDPVEGLTLLRTEDDGGTWTTVATGLGAGRTPPTCWGRLSYGVFRADPSVLYKTDGKVHRGDDGGATWRALDMHTPGDPDYFAGDHTYSDVAVSPTNPDRIAYAHHGTHLRSAATVRDMATDELASVPGESSTWTHPETGSTYYASHRGGLTRGIVDFAGVELVNLTGGSSDYSSGFGFSSDIPPRYFDVWVDQLPGGTVPPVLVRGPNAGDLPTAELQSAGALLQKAHSIAVDGTTGAIYLAGDTRASGEETREVAIVSTDGGESWTDVGDMSGQLYFLSGHAGPFLQTEDDLYRLAVPTSVSPTHKLSTTWGSLKRVR